MALIGADRRSGLAAHDAIDGTDIQPDLGETPLNIVHDGIGRAAERWPFFGPLRIDRRDRRGRHNSDRQEDAQRHGRRPVEASRPCPPG